MKRVLLLCFLTLSILANAQVITREDSLSAGLVPSNNSTVLSGYGSINYAYNATLREAVANIDRMVLFVGHKFNKRIALFSELELEDARVVGGKFSGQFSLEQLFLKFNMNRNNYINVGLFAPRIGIMNENHLPTTFNGNHRPFVETLILPATWREIGVGYYGNTDRVPGLNYSAALLTGLSSEHFTNGTGIEGGSLSGAMAKSNALAVTGALLYYVKDFRFQASGYFGGSAGLKPYIADSLQLQAGVFGTPVAVSEFNAQYLGRRWHVKMLGAWVNIPNADRINRAYANNTPEQMLGAYLDVSYSFVKKEEKDLRGFVRYEYLNMNLKLPTNGIKNGTLDQQYLIAGLCFKPIHGVIIKAEYSYRMTGNINPALIVTPYPVGQPFYAAQHSVNIGVGYSF